MNQTHVSKGKIASGLYPLIVVLTHFATQLYVMHELLGYPWVGVPEGQNAILYILEGFIVTLLLFIPTLLFSMCLVTAVYASVWGLYFIWVILNG